MDVLELNGNTYVKASSIARELGYTADYVGQLCRGGKVDAQLVGRSWYVNDDSIRSHKNSRYRSTKAKTSAELKNTIQEEGKEVSNKITNRIPVRVQSQHFYAKMSPNDATYTEDASDLIPVLTEKISDGSYTEIEVRHADAKQVTVKKSHKPYSLMAEKRPAIRFTGNVSVVEPDDLSDLVGEETAPGIKSTEQDATVEEKSSVHVSKKAEPRKTSKKMRIQDTEGEAKRVIVKREGIVAMRRIVPAKDGSTGELLVTSINSTSNTRTGRAAFVYITASLVVAVILGAGAIFIESSIVATSAEGKPVSAYSFNLSSVLDSIRP